MGWEQKTELYRNRNKILERFIHFELANDRSPSVGDPGAMKLKRFLLRYYPPGIILEYQLRDGTREMKEIDLLHLTAECVRLSLLNRTDPSTHTR